MSAAVMSAELFLTVGGDVVRWSLTAAGAMSDRAVVDAQMGVPTTWFYSLADIPIDMLSTLLVNSCSAGLANTIRSVGGDCVSLSAEQLNRLRVTRKKSDG